MISEAYYVQCDECGDPAEVSTEGKRMARRYARAQGYSYSNGRDLCPRCRDDEPPARHQAEEEMTQRSSPKS